MKVSLIEGHVRSDGVELKAGRFNPTTVIFAGRNQRMVATVLKFERNRKIRVNIAERAVGGKYDTFAGIILRTRYHETICSRRLLVRDSTRGAEAPVGAS